MTNYFVTGIDTNIGKTVCSSIIVEALKADYWKPIQCGDLDNSDSMKIKELVSNDTSVIHEESYKFRTPASPHLASEIEKVEISLDEIRFPQTNNDLVIEGAGGILVPLNNKDVIIDIVRARDVKVILVTKNYLGSLNHTLLSIEYLKSNGFIIEGMIFNGTENPKLERFLIEKTGIRKLGNIKEEKVLNKEIIVKYAQKLRKVLKNE